MTPMYWKNQQIQILQNCSGHKHGFGSGRFPVRTICEATLYLLKKKKK